MDYHIDATRKRFGRLASEIAVILQGKKTTRYNPRYAGSDRVMLSNIQKLTIGGVKAREKRYYRHTGYMGHLKSYRFEELFLKNPEKVLRDAVRRMLPKNRLAIQRLKNLVFLSNDSKK